MGARARSSPRSCFPKLLFGLYRGWLVLVHHIKGGWSLFICLASFCSRGPPFAIFLRIVAVILDLVAFIVALTSFPYSAGCDTNTSSGCQVLKAAIGVDGVLWCVAHEDFVNA
jgi:hypothetical protein